MEMLKASVLSACILSAAAGLLTLIRPGKLDRQLQFLMSLLFVVSLTTPFLHWEMPETLEVLAGQQDTENAALTEAVAEQILSVTRQQTEQALLQMLTESGIICTSLTVQLHIDPDTCIYCSEVTAVCDDPAAAGRILQAALGKEVKCSVTEMVP